MKRSYRKLLRPSVFLFAIISLTMILSFHDVFAADSSADIAETTFFGNLKDDGQGCGVYTVLNLVVEILSIGIGILGVIGIMVVGIQYLTAKGNEEQAKKAKRRIFEIILGLAAYAVLFAVIQWLLPGGLLNSSSTCTTVSDEELAQIRAKEQAAKQEAIDKANANKADKTNKTDSSSSSDDSSSTTSTKNTAPYLKESQFNRECLRKDNLTTGEKIVCILDKISIWADQNNVHYGNKSWKGNNTLMNCATFTSAAYIEAGLLKKGDYFALQGTSVQNWDKVSKRGTLVKTKVSNNAKIKTLASQGKLLPGDVIGLKSHHTYMYIGKNSSGEHMCQQLGRGQTIFNGGSHKHNKSKFKCGGRVVYEIVHPKRDITISL